MRGTERVIELLNEALECELSAIAQHIVHAEMLHISGNGRHGLYITKQAIEEMLHARCLIGRILVLKGLPRVDAAPAPRIGGSFPEQLENDLTADREAVNQYCSAAAICGRAGDTVSQALLEKMVTKKEENADYLEAELSAHAEAGLESGAGQRIHTVPSSLQKVSASCHVSSGVGREPQTARRKRTV
jgi:bacterioferritin